jgi:heme/copper-type cytochrome/quinol oxidase subunit 3
MLEKLIDKKRPQDWGNLVLAICLFASPWVFGFIDDQVPARNAWASAIVIGGLAIAALSILKEWEEWVNLALGAWVFVSPWALGFLTNVNAHWSHVVIGALVAAIAAWSIWDIRHMPHATT